MPYPRQERRVARAFDSWTYPEAGSAEVATVEANSGLPTSPVAVVGLALGWVTVGLEGNLDNPVVNEAATTLQRAARFVPVPEPALVLVPGTVAGAPARWTRRQACDLVLFADVDDHDDRGASDSRDGDGR